jgi:hypothetical protein
MEPKIAASKANSRLGAPCSDQNARTWSGLKRDRPFMLLLRDRFDGH